MFKYILLFLIFYFIYRMIRNFFRRLINQAQRPGTQNPGVNPDGHVHNQNAARPKYNIDQRDIVDAQFEELKPDTDKNGEKPDIDTKPEDDKNKK